MERNLGTLPVETLSAIFDMLSFKDRISASRTCKRWRGILTDARYIRHCRFHICVENLCYADNERRVRLWNLDNMKRYRTYKITDARIPDHLVTYFLGALRLFLSHEDVMRNVEELHLKMHQFSVTDVFANCLRWNFIKLRVINYSETTTYDRLAFPSPSFMAPQLQQLHLQDIHLAMSPMVVFFSRQIEALEVKFINKSSLFRTISASAFTNLRSLTINAVPGIFLLTSYRLIEFNDQALEIFAQLRYLKICDHDGLFYSIYEHIFQKAVHLETLIVIGHTMSAGSFNAIDNLKELRELCFLVYIERYWEVVRLSLPLLEKLTSYVNEFVPLMYAPKLKLLRVESPIFIKSRIRFPELGRLRRSIAPTICQELEELHLRSIQLDTSLIDEISTLGKLKLLELNKIELDMAVIDLIADRLPQLKHFRICRCSLVREVSLTDLFVFFFWKLDENEEIANQFRELRHTYPARRFENINNKLLYPPLSGLFRFS